MVKVNKLIFDCDDVCFQHPIGSELINIRSEDSDFDVLQVCKSKIFTNSKKFSYVPHDIDFSSIYHYQSSDFKIHDFMTVTGNSIILSLLNRRKPSAIDLGKILSHLYAIKYNLIEKIDDKETFDLYTNWLKVPGLANLFWDFVKSTLWNMLATSPTKELNWSQNFDNSEKHNETKKRYYELGINRYPTVDSMLGYDIIQYKKSLQIIFIAKSLLSFDSVVSDEELFFLNRIKNRQVSYEEYQVSLKKIWKDFRIASESIHQCYFLGKGYTLDESKEQGLFGTAGIRKVMAAFIKE
jgi:hypothetical protein